LIFENILREIMKLIWWFLVNKNPSWYMGTAKFPNSRKWETTCILIIQLFNYTESTLVCRIVPHTYQKFENIRTNQLRETVCVCVCIYKPVRSILLLCTVQLLHKGGIWWKQNTPICLPIVLTKWGRGQGGIWMVREGVSSNDRLICIELASDCVVAMVTESNFMIPYTLIFS